MITNECMPVNNPVVGPLVHILVPETLTLLYTRIYMNIYYPTSHIFGLTAHQEHFLLTYSYYYYTILLLLYYYYTITLYNYYLWTHRSSGNTSFSHTITIPMFTYTITIRTNVPHQCSYYYYSFTVEMSNGPKGPTTLIITIQCCTITIHSYS